LPAPEGPITPKISPRSTVSETSARAATWAWPGRANVLETESRRIMGGAGYRSGIWSGRCAGGRDKGSKPGSAATMQLCFGDGPVHERAGGGRPAHGRVLASSIEGTTTCVVAL